MATKNFSYENMLAVAPSFQIYHECDEFCDTDCGEEGMFVDFDQDGFEIWKQDLVDDLFEIGYKEFKGSIYYEIENKSGETWKEIEVKFLNGYYEGNNVDYVIENFEECEPEEKQELEQKLTDIISKTRSIIMKHTTEYKIVAQFSNGEAVYEKA